MSDTEIDPFHASTTSDELGNAVARWEYEGGADADGPQEGFRLADLPVAHRRPVVDKQATITRTTFRVATGSIR